MKKARLGLSATLVFCLLLTLISAAIVPNVMAQKLASTITPGTEFPIKNYTDTINGSIGTSSGTLPATIDPWKAEIYKDGAWISTNKGEYNGEYTYLFDSGINYYYPGAAFYSNQTATASCGVLGPGRDGKNAAWAFTVPQDGEYTFSHWSDSTSVAYELTQNFQMMSGDATTEEVGVRITVDGAKVWPASDEWTIVKKGAPVVVPNIPNLILNQGQVLRVEATYSKATNIDYTSRIYAGGHMTYNGPIPLDTEAPIFKAGNITMTAETGVTMALTWPGATDNRTTESLMSYKVFSSKQTFEQGTVPTAGGIAAPNKTSVTLTGLETGTNYYIAVVATDAAGNSTVITGGPFKTSDAAKDVAVYESYGYMDDIQKLVDEKNQAGVDINKMASASPWKAQVQISNVWTSLTTADRFSEYIYAHMTAPNTWGDNYPGLCFYAPKTVITGRNLSALMPSYNASNFKSNASLAFIAPTAGTYTFSHSSDAASAGYDSTQYFRTFDSAAKDQKHGVRITINDKQIWPVVADKDTLSYELQDGWAVIPGFDNPGVKVPTIPDISLKAGDILRVEATALNIAEMPWYQRVTACVAMTQNVAASEDKHAPAFSEGTVSLDTATDTSLKVKWPTATDDQTADRAVKYTVYVGSEAFTESTIPTEGGIVSDGSMSAIISDLDAATNYYVAVVASDMKGNQKLLAGGPFKTLEGSAESSDDDDNVVVNPTEPLEVNMPANSAGIIKSENGSARIGWNNKSGISFYRAYLFSKSGSGYTLEFASDSLEKTVSEYLIENLGSKNYVIQVVGYNIQGSPIEVYPLLSLDLSVGGEISNIVDNIVNPSTGEKIAYLLFAAAAISGACVLYNKKKKGILTVK